MSRIFFLPFPLLFYFLTSFYHSLPPPSNMHVQNSRPYLGRVLNGLHEGLVGGRAQVGGPGVLPVRHPEQLLNDGGEVGRETVRGGRLLLV